MLLLSLLSPNLMDTSGYYFKYVTNWLELWKFLESILAWVELK